MPDDILGEVHDGTPTIQLELEEPRTVLERVVVDSGFAGALRVPGGTFDAWGLVADDWTSVALADGSTKDCPTAIVVVRWFNRAIPVLAVEFGLEPLAGMGLLDGTRIEFRGTELQISLLE